MGDFGTLRSLLGGDQSASDGEPRIRVVGKHGEVAMDDIREGNGRVPQRFTDVDAGRQSTRGILDTVVGQPRPKGGRAGSRSKASAACVAMLNHHANGGAK